VNALRFAVIGSPVAHSKSPAMHGAAYRVLGLPHVYEKLETTEAELPARVDAVRRGELAGLNVTVPHKTRVLSFVDEVADSARAIGAANTLVREDDGRVVAHNTDVPALAEELARLAGSREPFVGRTGLVLGTGGAGLAAIRALASLGIRRVVVRGRLAEDASRAASFVRVAEDIMKVSPHVATTSVIVQPLEPEPVPELAAIVQATSCGMTGGGPGHVVEGAVSWETVPGSAVALDVVYAPRDTPFLARARAQGLASDDGLGMLAAQGALALELWLGVAAPRDVMRAALAC
jgi:shikimate dehydrogenase